MTRPTTTRSNSSGRVIHKSARPSPLKLTKGPNTHKTSPPSAKGRGKRDSHCETDDDHSDEMAALPNFCTTCEKQIINPHATFLYCSEACRRKDGARPTSTALETGVPSPPPGLNVDAEEEPFMDIVPQRSPTVIRPASIVSFDSLGEGSGSDANHSEASQYLSQFLPPGSASPGRRPRSSYYRNPTTSSHTTVPSLINTPNSLASPLSSYSSVSRTAPSRIAACGSRHANSRSFDFGMPASMSRSEALRSKASTETAFRPSDGEITYEKRPMAPTPSNSPCAGSLKQLFAHEAMRRPSSLAHNTSSSSLSRMVESEGA